MAHGVAVAPEEGGQGVAEQEVAEMVAVAKAAAEWAVVEREAVAEVAVEWAAVELGGGGEGGGGRGGGGDGGGGDGGGGAGGGGDGRGGVGVAMEAALADPVAVNIVAAIVAIATCTWVFVAVLSGFTAIEVWLDVKASRCLAGRKHPRRNISQASHICALAHIEETWTGTLGWERRRWGERRGRR